VKRAICIVFTILICVAVADCAPNTSDSNAASNIWLQHGNSGSDGGGGGGGY